MQTEIRIGNRTIGKGYAPFIIAEAGINHNGDIKLAKKMIRAAKACMLLREMFFVNGRIINGIESEIRYFYESFIIR